ncbi:PREDICTED: rho GTPase-activating protein 27-like, partial [Calidris pugnax]|uniref:rho GTPase-activating protein 27-like n=1 Tax=Calidris pugnax TaxID=198806 RepID=UPI00071CE4E6
PPTPETDYPDLSPDELEGYPEEDYSPVGSYDQGAAFSLSVRRPEELGSPPGWYGHSHPEGAVFYPEHFTSDTVPASGRHKRASSGSSQDSGLFAWHSPVSPALGLKEEKFKSLEKAGVLNRTKTVDRGKRLRKNWSSSWTVLEGGILTFFKDSKHSAAGALVRAPTASVGPAPMGRGQHPWDRASTHGMGPAPMGWGQEPRGAKPSTLQRGHLGHHPLPPSLPPQVPASGRHKRASSGSSQDSGLFAWHSPVSPALGLKEEKFKSLEKAGVLNRTKTVDRGKRLRKKNWSSSWTVLEGGILTFFKDSKHSAAGALRHPSTLTTPEHTVELRGATLAWAGKDKSSKKHVLELKTREGSEFLIQHDSEQIIAAWQKAIADSIGKMGTDLLGEDDTDSAAEFGSREKLGGSEEKRAAAGQGMGSASGENDSSKVRNKLRKFLQRRPTMQSLRERGYIKDQIFGCSLQALCERERGTVPRFVLQCIQTVERRGLDIDGLYRVSGNLATIQKLRYKVEHEEHLDLDDGRWEDIHVVTGALKLFFRELPEPLVPFGHFDKFIAAIKMQDPTRRGQCIRDLVFSLPPAHHDTMKVLFRHLSRVIEYKEENRMSVQSIAIVFGPTLLRPASEEGNMAMHMVFQNQVVEHILNQYGYIFPDG